MPPVAIVPAAGRSQRFGSPKLIAAVDGEPMLARTLRCLLDAGVPRVVIAAALETTFESVPLTRDRRVTIVVNPDPGRGMFSSLQAAFAAADGDPILVLPADMPFVRVSTIVALLAAYARTPGLVTPTYRRRHGHPIALPGHVRSAALAAPATSALDALIETLALPRIELDVDDPGILRDVDRPSDLNRLDEPLRP
jgi:molybdenum cofactor cytidylyltransferase